VGEESGRLTVVRIPVWRRGPGSGAVRGGILPLAVLVALAPLSVPALARCQVRQDTLVVDTLAAQERPDTLPVDSTAVDTVFYNLPDLDEPAASGWQTGVWVWDQDDLAASGALTLVDLFLEVPGILPLLTGDFATPQVVTAFGLGGGRIRVLRDGFELFPLEGGVPDFTRIGLAGIGRVRLVRGGTELRVELSSLEHHDARPFSLIQAGTGDLNTNFLRGSFLGPHALGGSVAAGLERLDSRGPRGDEPGQRTGAWVRYQLHRGDDAGLAVDFRRMGSSGEIEPYAAEVTRTDWAVRGRARLGGRVTGEAYYGESTHHVGDTRQPYEREGGTRTQIGVRALVDAPGLRALAAYRRFGGDDLPKARLEASVEAHAARVGGVSAEVDHASWQQTSASTKRVRAWTAALWGFSLFGSWESGSAGTRLVPVRDRTPPPDTSAVEEPDTTTAVPEEDPLFHLSDRTATRVGAMFSWRGLAASGARLRLDADSLLPLGLEPDRGQPALRGGVRSGWELWGRIPLPFMTGLAANGSLQQWDEAWSYLPERSYRASFDYHRTFLESGNFELWLSLGVRGRDPMTVREVLSTSEDEEGTLVTELASVPFAQSWYGRIQARIVTVLIFVGWENFTIRRNLQDFPDRLLPQTRAVYGLQWTMWN
jgi:hypothetical protein